MRKHLTIFTLLVFSFSLQAQFANTNNDLPKKLTKAQLEEKDQKIYKSSQLDVPLYYKSFVAVYQLDSMKYEDFDDNNGTWHVDDLEILTYNADKQCIAEVDFDFNTGSPRDTSDVYWYDYDVDGNWILEISADWSNGAWDTSWKEVIHWSPTNQYLGYTEYDYDNGQWEENWKSELTYDSNGYLIKMEYFDWDNGTWDLYSIEDIVNHSDGRIESEVRQYRSNSTFVPDDSTYFTYNSSLQLIEELRYEWDQNNSMWEEYRLSDYTYYNTTGELETRTRYYKYNSNWDTSYMYHYIYNSQGFLTERIDLDWNNGLFENDYKDVYTYDMNYSYPDITANPYYLDDLLDMLLTESEFTWNNSDLIWEDYGRDVLYWSRTGFNIGENQFEDIKVYPVPTTDKLNIELSSFESTNVQLVDLTGCLMQEKQMNSTIETLDVEGYSSGLYLLIIERNGNTAVQKVVIQ